MKTCLPGSVLGDARTTRNAGYCRRSCLTYKVEPHGPGLRVATPSAARSHLFTAPRFRPRTPWQLPPNFGCYVPEGNSAVNAVFKGSPMCSAARKLGSGGIASVEPACGGRALKLWKGAVRHRSVMPAAHQIAGEGSLPGVYGGQFGAGRARMGVVFGVLAEVRTDANVWPSRTKLPNCTHRRTNVRADGASILVADGLSSAWRSAAYA